MYGQGACGRKGATTTCAAHSNDRLKNYVGDISQECFQNDVKSSIFIGYRGRERHLAYIFFETNLRHMMARSVLHGEIPEKQIVMTE